MTTLTDLITSSLARAYERPLPESTYRLQFHAGFTFRDAIAIVPYLRDLGISHLYASPFLKSRKGSTHGYDIVDHRSFNPEIGSAEDFDALASTLREHEIGLILDIVPNHMGIATDDNLWWNDVLENGPASQFAGYFDIAWKDTARPELQQKVLLPVLGDPYGRVLEAGQLVLEFEARRFFLKYCERRFPIAPRSYAIILSHRLEELIARLGVESLDLAEYQSILIAISHLPDRTETDRAKVIERSREKEIVKRRIGVLTSRNEAIGSFIQENVAIFNGTPGDPRSFDRLDDLLSHQCYRLSFWRVALEEINYRRFFDVNDLAALCVERDDVFNASHEMIFRLLVEGKIDGLRVDHPDGLYDPREYFYRLQRHYLLAMAKEAFSYKSGMEGVSNRTELEGRALEQIDAVLNEKDGNESRWPLFVVAEKILGPSEQLPSDWAVAGTSGYEFLRAVNNLFVDGSSEAQLTQLYRESYSDYAAFAEVLYRSKRLILSNSLAAELNMLAYQLDRLAQKDRRSRDFTRNGLRDALREVIACFPLYRSYISNLGVGQNDISSVEEAVRGAASRNPLVDVSILRFVEEMILLKYPIGATEEDREEQLRFACKFQQVTSPVMAKGLEDTSFYIYNRLVSLNEVGGSPEWPRNGPEALHRFNEERRANWPHALSPLSTHDTKRSEDVRARIDVLSEMPDEWGNAVRSWMALNEVHRTNVKGRAAPDSNDEYVLYQTLVGVWPQGRSEGEGGLIERVKAYMVKALREAKVHTSWLNPDEAYEGGVARFIERILDPATGKAFLEAFRPFQRRVSNYGALNSLAQTLLKLTAPGVPDTFQGTELPEFSLVDPDNRRPVDYGIRQAMLNDIRSNLERSDADRAGFARGLTESLEDGRAKLFLHWRLLNLRRKFPGLFSEGEYFPLAKGGVKSEHVFSFARKLKERSAIVVVPRLTFRLAPDFDQNPLCSEVWADTHLSLGEFGTSSTWVEAFTGSRLIADRGEIAVAKIFAHFPIALLFEETHAGSS